MEESLRNAIFDMPSLDWSSKAEIGDDKLIVLVDQQVIRLHIPVNDTLLVSGVQSVQQLPKIVTADWLAEGSSLEVIKDFLRR